MKQIVCIPLNYLMFHWLPERTQPLNLGLFPKNLVNMYGLLYLVMQLSPELCSEMGNEVKNFLLKHLSVLLIPLLALLCLCLNQSQSVLQGIHLLQTLKQTHNVTLRRLGSFFISRETNLLKNEVRSMTSDISATLSS